MLNDVRVKANQRSVEITSSDPVMRASITALVHRTDDFDEGHWILVHIRIDDPKQRKQGLGSELQVEEHSASSGVSTTTRKAF